MSTETRINVGAVIGMGMLLVTVMVFQSASTNARIDELRVDVNTRFDRQDARFDRLDARFDRLDARFDRLDARVGSLDTRVGSLDTRVGSLDARVGSLDTRVGSLDTRMDSLDTRMDSLRSDMREDHAAIGARLDAFQESLADILQRLAHIEGRLGMPRGGDAEAAPGN